MNNEHPVFPETGYVYVCHHGDLTVHVMYSCVQALLPHGEGEGSKIL